MTEYLTEQEQIEILKSWIKQYSVVILAGVVIAVVAITGWRYWQQREARILSHASAIYDEMLTNRAQNDPAATYVQAKKLFTHYPQTTYGKMAAFMLARAEVTKRNYPEAEKYLRWVLDHSNQISFRQIAKLRLARVQIAGEKPQAALETLATVEDKSFNGLVEEVRGDAYLALNKPANARESYKQALVDLPNAETIRPLLQMKYDNLTTINQAS